MEVRDKGGGGGGCAVEVEGVGDEGGGGGCEVDSHVPSSPTPTWCQMNAGMHTSHESQEIIHKTIYCENNIQTVLEI